MITNTAAVVTTLKRHGLSAAFLNPPDKELDRMAEDIRDHGLIEPIVTIVEDGERFVLDGWGRYRCCLKAGVEPRFVDFNEMKTGLTPRDFVMSRNMFRKHLSATQRACIAVEIYEGKFVTRGGWQTRPSTEDQMLMNDRANGRVTRAEVARIARVSPTMMTAAKSIKAADPVLFQKIKSGEVPDIATVYVRNPRLRIGPTPADSGSLNASRALSPMLIGVRNLVDGLKLKPAEFAKQWAIWEGHDKAQRLKAMKQAHQWLDEAITAVETQAA